MKLGNRLLIVGVILFCIGYQKEVEPYRNGALQKDTDTGVTNVVEAEEADEVKEEQFPHGMLIPDARDAVLPEISHLHKYFSRKTDELSEIEKKYYEKRGYWDELSIECENMGETIDIFIHIVQSEYDYTTFRGTAYKQENTNLYVGDIYSSEDSDKMIGKYVISYQIDEAVMSVGYFEKKDREERAGLLEEGVYQLYHCLTPFELEVIQEVGNKITCTDYSDYSGRWLPIYPVGVRGVAMPVRKDSMENTYMELNIDSKGLLHGNMSQYKGFLEKNVYTEFSGIIKDGECIVEYEDDGYGHGGTMFFTFCENGIIVYIDENGEPGVKGFPTGNNYYTKE